MFRYRFICSKFHRGRAIIQWDPVADISTVANAANQAFTKVVDISETTDVEIEVPYLQSTAYKETPLYNNGGNLANTYTATTTGGTSGYSNVIHNGYLTVKCLTAQTSPVNSADIKILLSVRGGPDLEFANPVDPPNNTTMFTLQSKELVNLDDTKHLYVGESTSDCEMRNLVFMGEKIRSLRQILRRTTFLRGTVAGGDTSNLVKVTRCGHLWQPLYRGYDTNGINSAKGTLTPGSNYAFNFVKVTPYTWIANAFMGWRGAHVWHYNVVSPLPLGHIKASRIGSGIGGIGPYLSTGTLASGGTGSANASYFSESYNNCFSGMSLTNQQTQAGLSVHYPMYTTYRFRSTDPGNCAQGSANDETNEEYLSCEFETFPAASTTMTASTSIKFYHAIGTDFSLIFFINVPSIIQLATPTAN